MTEKKVWTLKVDGELRGLIPPLSTEERKMLEESIVRDGCDTPLTVWEGTIVDGHNRYDICREHGIPFAIEERSFDNKEAVMFWMHSWLIRLGCGGTEHKDLRRRMIQKLDGYCAFPDETRAQRHRDKYKEIRRIRREVNEEADRR